MNNDLLGLRENALAMNLPINTKVETVGKVTSEFYEFSYIKKDKDGKEVSTAVQIRDKATVMALTDIDLFSGLAKMSIKGFVIALSKIAKEEAKKACGGSVVDLVEKCHPEYSRTTLNMYRRIGLMFADRSKDGYEWKVGIPSSVSVNNLSVVLALASQKKELEECKETEIDELFEEFYANYIATGLIILTTSQSELKKQVKNINSGIIEGESKELSDNSENEKKEEEDSESAIEVTEEVEKKDNIEQFKEQLAYYSEIFKDNKKIVKAIAEIIRELSE